MLIQKLYSFMQKLLTESDIVVKSAIFMFKVNPNDDKVWERVSQV